ncbi:hypothetical protein LguiB_009917 [Lonicera macranthoides]
MKPEGIFCVNMRENKNLFSIKFIPGVSVFANAGVLSAFLVFILSSGSGYAIIGMMNTA